MSLSLIVVHDVNTYRENLGPDLSNCGFSVRTCGSASGFLSALESGPATVVVLVSTPPHIVALASQVRRLAHGSLLVALFDDTDPALRVRVLQAGADACHSLDLSAPELAVALLGWALRQGRARATPASLAGEAPMAAQRGPSLHPGAADPQSPLSATLAAVAQAQSGSPRSGPSPGPSPGPSRTAAPQRPERCPPLHQRLHAPQPLPLRQSLYSLQRLQQRAQRQMRPPDPLKPLEPLPAPIESEAARREPAWCLQEHGRVLVGPLGQSLSLTASESLFLSRLMASAGRLIRRDAGGAESRGLPKLPHDAAPGAAGTRGVDAVMPGVVTSCALTPGAARSGAAEQADEAGNEAEAHDPGGNAPRSEARGHDADAFNPSSSCAAEGAARPGPSRSLDVLVSRLRRKAQKRGVDLPLLAVRGWGYLFLDRLDRAPD